MVDDRALLQRVSRGDEEAFAELFRRLQPRVSRFAFRIARRPELVEEIVNDTLLVVWTQARRFRGDSRVSTWVLGIAYRTALKRLRASSRHQAEELPESLPHDEPGGAERRIFRRQTRRRIQQALERLSPEHRAVVELAFYEELGYREIAEIVGCPVNTVKTRMFHARRNLKRILRIQDARPASPRSGSDA